MVHKALYWLYFPLVWLYSRLMMKMDIEWLEKLPPGPKIIAANHPSTTDPFLIAALAKHPAHILILNTIFKIPVVGTILRASGHIPVVPQQGKLAFERAKQLLEKGQSVIIFPEGLISPAGGFHRPRTGVARLALATKAQVIPVGIHLDHNRVKLIQSRIDGEDEVGTWYFRGPYHVTFGTPLSFSGDLDDREQVTQIAETIMDQIKQLSQRSQQRANV